MSPSIDLWTGIVSFIMPLIVSIVIQSHWSKPIKTTAAAIVCLIAAFIEVSLKGELTATNLTGSTLTILGATIVFFKGFWKPLGVADALEEQTDILPAPPEPRAQTLPSQEYGQPIRRVHGRPLHGTPIPGLPNDPEDGIPNVSYEIDTKL